MQHEKLFVYVTQAFSTSRNRLTARKALGADVAERDGLSSRTGPREKRGRGGTTHLHVVTKRLTFLHLDHLP
ncbi:hypothetical protein [Synechococcus sp. M16CYN]|uniref:hypothetical protein n=1 Tax=Synechococcus sp. M16CYN TaxID=3103139 RepID=UPI003341C864